MPSYKNFTYSSNSGSVEFDQSFDDYVGAQGKIKKQIIPRKKCLVLLAFVVLVFLLVLFVALYSLEAAKSKKVKVAYKSKGKEAGR